MTENSVSNRDEQARAHGPLLSGQAFKADPYSTYAELRSCSPLYGRTSADGQARLWLVLNHADVDRALRDPALFVKNIDSTRTAAELAAQPPDPVLYRLLTQHMLNADGATHARLRSLVSKAFSARQIERLEPQILASAHRLIDRSEEQGSMDLVEDYALPLAIDVIAVLLGFAPRDRQRLRSWARALMAPSASAARNQRKTAKLQRVMEDFIAYVRRECDERRRTPRPDLLSALLEAEEAGDRLSEDELYSMVLLIAIVGHETSVYLIANAVLTLLDHPEAWQQLRGNPGQIAQAVEELIRFDGPVERATMRFAAADMEWHGCHIQRGDAVSLVLASAHRDVTAYPHPDELDLQRGDVRHLGFGAGVHYCLGAPLARLEARVALAVLLERRPTLRLAVSRSDLHWHTNPILRGPKHLPVTW